ncbi:MAG: hypothetical protein AB9866_05505 [Syntrophobacteraceae bacterium]
MSNRIRIKRQLSRNEKAIRSYVRALEAGEQPCVLCDTPGQVISVFMPEEGPHWGTQSGQRLGILCTLCPRCRRELESLEGEELRAMLTRMEKILHYDLKAPGMISPALRSSIG